jgi:hypothetical protein
MFPSRTEKALVLAGAISFAPLRYLRAPACQGRGAMLSLSRRAGRRKEGQP